MTRLRGIRRLGALLCLGLMSSGCRFFPMSPLEVLAVDVTDPDRLLLEFSAIPDLARVEAALSLRQPERAVYGRVTREGTTIRFLPEKPLDPEKRYTLIVSTRAEDLHGNALKRPYVHEFGPEGSYGSEEALAISADSSDDGDVLLSFSHRVRPSSLYEHLSIHPEQRYRVDVAEDGRGASIVLLSPPAVWGEVVVSIARGMLAQGGRRLDERFSYRLPEPSADGPPQRVSVCVFAAMDEPLCSPMSEDSSALQPVPGLDDFDRDTRIQLSFTVPVYAADLFRTLSLSPTAPLELILGPGIYVSDVGVHLPSTLDPDTDYVLELDGSIRDQYGRRLGDNRFATLRPAARDYREPSVSSIRFSGETLSDGGAFDLSAFSPHTEETLGILDMFLEHASNATVSALDVLRHFRIRAWSNSARFRLVSASATAVAPGSTRIRMGLEVIDEAGRFGVVSMELRPGLTDSLGNRLGHEWRIDLNQIGGPNP